MVQQLHWSHWEVDNLHTCPKQEGEDFNFSSKKEPILKVVDQLSTPAFHNTSSNKKVSKAAWRENFFIFFHVFIFTSAVFIWFCTTISCCNSHVLVFNRGNKKVMTTSWRVFGGLSLSLSKMKLLGKWEKEVTVPHFWFFLPFLPSFPFPITNRVVISVRSEQSMLLSSQGNIDLQGQIWWDTNIMFKRESFQRRQS